VAVGLLGLLITGCGSRVDDAELLAAAGGGPVTLSPATIAQLRGPAQPPIGDARPAERQAGASAAPARPSAAVPEVVPGARASTGAAAAAAPTRVSEHPRTPACTRPLPPVNVGQVGTFSGVAGAITAGARAAAAVWAKDVNTRGGLDCRTVQLFSTDDGADPARAAAAVQDLVDRHHVVALIANIVPFTAAGFVPAITAAKLPALGGDMLAPEWDTSAWMFPQGSAVDDQLIGGIGAGVQSGHRRLGLLYCVEVSSCGQVDTFLRNGGARTAGADFVYDAPISITQPDYTAECLNAKQAGVDLLLLGMDGGSMARLTRSCVAVDFRPLLLTGAATFSLKNTEDSILRSFRMLTASPVAPWTADDTPGLQAFHRAMQRYRSDLPPDGETVIGWSSGILLEAALNHLSTAERAETLTPRLVVQGLGRIHDETLGGLTSHLTFNPALGHATGTGCIYLMELTAAGWTAPDGSHPRCR
jgi:branched-chain amino acid transport system substrate-binding protein